MSHSTQITTSNRSVLPACAFAMVVLFLTSTPNGAQAQETTKPKPTPTVPMDHAKPMDHTKPMDHSAGMDHSKMEGMSKTGDVDLDFAANMRMHHQMAVDMAQAEIKNGKDPKMLSMARSILASQKREIAMFDQWLAAHNKSKPMPESNN